MPTFAAPDSKADEDSKVFREDGVSDIHQSHDEVPNAEAMDVPPSPSPPPPTTTESTLLGMVELLLKDQHRLDHLTRSTNAQREFCPRLLGVGLIGYIVFGVTLAIFFSVAEVWPEVTPVAHWLNNHQQGLIHFAPTPDASLWRHWLDGSACKLTAAFTLGLLGAIGVCLPSFYFYGLLAGVRASMLQVTTLALKGAASSAVALMGALPIYFAIVLGLVVFDAPQWLVSGVCFVGLVLPFITGLWGTRSLYIGFMSLADTMKPENRCRRECFLRRLLFFWSVCFTAVTPVMIFTLWETMSR